MSTGRRIGNETSYLNADKRNPGKTAVCEIIGDPVRNKEQQDTFTQGKLKNFDQLTPENQKKVFENVVKDLHEKIAENPEEANSQGSTFITTVAYTKKNPQGVESAIINTAHLADSRSYAVIYDKNGKITKCQRLNANLHKPDDPKEKESIQSKGGVVLMGKILDPRGRLSVARAFGDNAIKGVGKEVEVTQTEVEIPKGGGVKIITTCDGVFEGFERTGFSGKEEEEILFKLWLIAQYNSKGLHKIDNAAIAQDLVAAAFDGTFFPDCKKSTDNISAMVMDVGKDPVYNNVNDGHGGRFVAQQIQTLLPNKLNDEVSKLYQQQLQSKSAELPKAPANNAVEPPKKAQEPQKKAQEPKPAPATAPTSTSPSIPKTDHPSIPKTDHPSIPKTDHPSVPKTDHPSVPKTDHSLSISNPRSGVTSLTNMKSSSKPSNFLNHIPQIQTLIGNDWKMNEAKNVSGKTESVSLEKDDNKITIKQNVLTTVTPNEETFSTMIDIFRETSPGKRMSLTVANDDVKAMLVKICENKGIDPSEYVLKVVHPSPSVQNKAEPVASKTSAAEPAAQTEAEETVTATATHRP